MNLLISTDILEWIELHVGMRDQLSLLDGKSSCYLLPLQCGSFA
jgi:hypothetical protein